MDSGHGVIRVAGSGYPPSLLSRLQRTVRNSSRGGPKSNEDPEFPRESAPRFVDRLFSSRLLTVLIEAAKMRAEKALEELRALKPHAGWGDSVKLPVEGFDSYDAHTGAARVGKGRRQGGGRMIDEQDLREAVERIVAVANPSRVILFGSQGRGDPGEGSDLDLMVLKPSLEDRGREILQLYQAVGPLGEGVDLLLYSDAEFARRSQVPGTLLYWAAKEGRTLYESTP